MHHRNTLVAFLSSFATVKAGLNSLTQLLNREIELVRNASGQAGMPDLGRGLAGVALHREERLLADC